MRTSKVPDGKVWHKLVHKVIDEAVGNWTQQRTQEPNSQVKAILLKYATAVSGKVLNGDTPYPDFLSGWKKELSECVLALLDYETFEEEQIPLLVADLWDQFGDTTEKFKHDYWCHSLFKIANYVGSVTYMEKLGLDPELLSMTPEEANAGLCELAKQSEALLIDPKIDSPQEVAVEIVLRTNPPDVSKYLR